MEKSKTSATGMALTKGNAMPIASISDLQQIGELLRQTQLFGAQSAAEGFVIAAMCQQDGISYSEWMATNHMIHGRISKRADAILRDFNAYGGKHKVLERSPNRVAIELIYNDTTTDFELTWADCLKEPFIYEGRESDVAAALCQVAAGHDEYRAKLFMKPKYATPRSRTQMMWARLVSDSIRAVCPKAVSGYYTPEETEDFVGPENARPVEALPAETIPIEEGVALEPAAEQAQPVAKQKRKAAKKAEVVDAEVVTATTVAPETPPAEAPAAAAEPAPAAPEASPFVGAPETPAPLDPLVFCTFGTKLNGQRWDAMPTQVLKYALANFTADNTPEFTDEVRARVAAIVAERGEA